jgi:hypothetical protein
VRIVEGQRALADRTDLGACGAQLRFRRFEVLDDADEASADDQGR